MDGFDCALLQMPCLKGRTFKSLQEMNEEKYVESREREREREGIAGPRRGLFSLGTIHIQRLQQGRERLPKKKMNYGSLHE